MPTYEFGNMWSAIDTSDLFCITTNSILRRDGKLVMGRGIAKQAADRSPRIQDLAGQKISQLCGSGGKYGLIVLYTLSLCVRVGLFQVKYHWGDKADTSLIRFSSAVLAKWALIHSDRRIDLNFPGIGNGKLAVSEVKSILDEELPDNVHVWKYKRDT